MKRFFQEFCYIIISVIISFLIYRFITIRILDYIPFIIQYRGIVYICTNIIQSIFIYIILKGVIHNELDVKQKKMLWFQYFIVLIFLLFFRSIGVRDVELNIIQSSKDWIKDSYSIVIALMNILIFLPSACFFRKKTFKFSLITMFFIILGCEFIQFLLSVGIFDVGDIILNLLGFFIGLKIFKSNFVSKYLPFIAIDEQKL